MGGGQNTRGAVHPSNTNWLSVLSAEWEVQSTSHYTFTRGLQYGVGIVSGPESVLSQFLDIFNKFGHESILAVFFFEVLKHLPRAIGYLVYGRSGNRIFIFVRSMVGPAKNRRRTWFGVLPTNAIV